MENSHQFLEKFLFQLRNAKLGTIHQNQSVSLLYRLALLVGSTRLFFVPLPIDEVVSGSVIVVLILE